MDQVFRPFATKNGRKPPTRVQIPAGAPFYKSRGIKNDSYDLATFALISKMPGAKKERLRENP